MTGIVDHMMPVNKVQFLSYALAILLLGAVLGLILGWGQCNGTIDLLLNRCMDTNNVGLLIGP